MKNVWNDGMRWRTWIVGSGVSTFGAAMRSYR